MMILRDFEENAKSDIDASVDVNRKNRKTTEVFYSADMNFSSKIHKKEKKNYDY